jgi:type I restriction enzyme S subunit
MNYGLPEPTIEKIRGVFGRFPEIEKAVIYGSRAKGNFKPGSDIDLTLYGEALTSNLLPKIESALDDLLLPYKIDLSIFDELNHAKLRDHIERVGVVFYKRPVIKGWQTKPFERCIEPVEYTRKIQRKDFLSDGKFPIISQEEDFINGYWNNETDLFKVTTPIIVFGDHTKVLKYVDFDFVLGADGVKILQPRDFLLPKFFYYQLQTANLDSLGYARHYKLLKELEIVYPTRPEQQRIVDLLDEAFKGIATAKANAEKNLQNAHTLFESHLQSVFTQRGKGWVEKKLGDVCTEIFAGGDVPKDRLSQERTPKYSVPIFSNGEKDDGLYGFTDVARVTKPSITVSARGTLGFTAMRTEPFLPVVRLIVLVPDEKLIMLSFLYYAVVGMDFGNTGTSIPQLTVPNFKESKLHVPLLSEQKAVVEKLDALREKTQRLAHLYERKLAALEALKKSLLHQAFTGAL